MEVSTYYADAAALADPALYRKLYGSLPDFRKTKADMFVFAKDRRLSVGAWALLAAALADLGEEPSDVGFEAGGKPFLIGSDIRFNISHSEERVMCSVSDSDVGCDVEMVRDAGLEIAKRYFYGTEYDSIAAEADPEKASVLFCRLWTLKESFMKAVGLGMSLPLHSFEISLGGEASVRQDVDDRTYRFKEYDPGDGYRCAVCSTEGRFEQKMRRVDFASHRFTI